MTDRCLGEILDKVLEFKTWVSCSPPQAVSRGLFRDPGEIMICP
jgi:hypothetical protein